jgi:mono/diheme cytochrome c family protein
MSLSRISHFAVAFVTVAAALAPAQDAADFFEKKIRPVFAKNCVACHNSRVKTAGLDLSSLEGIAAGGQSGPLFVKGNADASTLIKVLSYDERLKMPPSGKLPAEQIADMKTWIQTGNALPAPASTSQVRPKGLAGPTPADKKFWAFQPMSNPTPPAVKNEAWASKNPVDRFILAKLEAKGLQPAKPASKATLLRRVTFNLTGLPPTEQELRDFLADNSPNALEKVVDRLLASPRYGEHWGRHWLDVARYADSTGNDEDHRYPYAWRYRDYVIDSVNKDVPFDQFVQEQIAGDLLPPGPRENVNKRGIVATGFLALGAKAVAQQDKKKMLVDIYDEQIDVVSKGILGLTMTCARCHDHKFDPLFTKDYYSWMGIFAKTRNFNNADTHVSSLLYTPLAPKEEYERFVKGREISDKKRNEMEDMIEDQTFLYTKTLGAKVADYMLAARDVQARRTTIDAAAQAKALDKRALNKWVAFLNESKTKRSYMADWFAANDQTAPQLAAAYQKRYVTKQDEWTKAMVRTRKPRRDRNRSMPPKIAAEDDVFFYDVHFKGPHALTDDERKIAWQPGKVEAVAKLKQEISEILASMPPEPEMACAVSEGTEGGVVGGKVYIRGDYNSFGEDAPPGVPAVLGDFNPPSFGGKTSGRLELAQWLTRPDHPLTARVFVNRAWYWHFGEGIVRTPDNFGKMGEKPTNPELLDYLAQQFIKDGWSIKQLQKRIILSNAYQMSSVTDDATYAADPDNILLSRFPRRRLSVEELHDGMMWLDQSLDTTMGGTLQSGFGTDGENSNDRLSMKPENIKRRSVYVPLRRANLPALLNLFDFGDATTSASKRSSTTIAPQALFLMNSDFVAERAKTLSDQAAREAASPADRVRKLYTRIMAREASGDEVDRGLSYLAQFRQKFPKRSDADAWMSFSRILLASNEYIYLD